MTDILERLGDPEYAGPMQHLRDWREIYGLMREAAAEINRLRAEVNRLKDQLGDPNGVIAHADAITSVSEAEIERLRQERNEAVAAHNELVEELRKAHKTYGDMMAEARDKALEEAAQSAVAAGRPVGWQPMSTAPKDGTRVLVRAVCFGWNTDICQNVAIGHRAIEASFRPGMVGSEPAWREWCGNEKTLTTDWIVAEGWSPLPITIDT